MEEDRGRLRRDCAAGWTACRWPSSWPRPGCAACRRAQLADRLDDRFRLLTGGSRTLLPRQQTLRAVVDWSWDLLDPAERVLLRRLAVFRGGWTLEEVEAVCADADVTGFAARAARRPERPGPAEPARHPVGTGAADLSPGPGTPGHCASPAHDAPGAAFDEPAARSRGHRPWPGAAGEVREHGPSAGAVPVPGSGEQAAGGPGQVSWPGVAGEVRDGGTAGVTAASGREEPTGAAHRPWPGRPARCGNMVPRPVPYRCRALVAGRGRPGAGVLAGRRRGGGPPAAGPQGVAGGTPRVGAADVAAVLAALVDKSLVLAAPDPAGDGRMRYRLLETVAEYAAERLAEAGETETVGRRHLVAYRELARTTDDLLHGPDQVRHLDRLESEHDNVRAALRRAVATGAEHEALCLVHAMGWFWQIRNHRADARTWAQAAAALGPDPFAPPVAPAPPVSRRCTDAPPPMDDALLHEARRGARLMLLADEESGWSTDHRDPAVQQLLDGVIAAYTAAPGLPQTCGCPACCGSWHP